MEPAVQGAVLTAVDRLLADEAGDVLLQLRVGDAVAEVAHRADEEVLSVGEHRRQRREHVAHDQIAVREVLGQLGRDIERAAAALLVLGRIDDQAPRVQVHLAADRAGQERFLTAVLAIPDDRVADGRHVHPQLVRAAG